MSGPICSPSNVIERLANHTPVTNPVTISLERALHNNSRPRGYGVLRHRFRTKTPDESAPRPEPIAFFCEALTRFMVSQGIPYDAILDEQFQDLIRILDPGHSVGIPKPAALEATAERLAHPGKPIVSLGKAIGPTSVTVDVVGNQNEKFLAFSIHYFEKGCKRKNAVCLRKMLLSKIDGASVMLTLRRAVNNFNYTQIRFTNLVCPNKEIGDLLRFQDVIKRDFICFYDYISRFVADLLRIPEFRKGLDQLRNFVRFVKSHADYYSKFRRMQLSKNSELDMPSLDSDSWPSTFLFLTNCLLFDDCFNSFVSRWPTVQYITRSTFFLLVCLQRILQQCVKYSRELSQPSSSISQVIPAIMELRNYIRNNPIDGQIDKAIKEAFSNTFQPLTAGNRSQRYDMAALLDPRFAYRETIYQDTVWLNIEKKVILEVVNEQFEIRKSLFKVITSSREGLNEEINQELRLYRSALYSSEEEIGDPFEWWDAHQDSLKRLSRIARDYLACPAVTIDATYFFGEAGKYKRISQLYTTQSLENCLSVASHGQKFRGRGADANIIPPHLNAVLDKLYHRRRLEMATETEKKKIVAMSSLLPPSKPTYDQMLEVKEEVLEAEVKEEVREADDSEVYENVIEGQSATTQVSTPLTASQKPVQYRRRHLCYKLESFELIKNVTIPTEKVFVILGSVFRGDCSILRAHDVFHGHNNLCLCRSHFAEACDAIFHKLNVSNVEQLALGFSNTNALKGLVDETVLINDTPMSIAQFQNAILKFVGKYSNASQSEKALALSKNEKALGAQWLSRKRKSLVRDNYVQIPPKSQRPPRKQVLDAIGDDDRTIREIKEETYFPDPSHQREQLDRSKPSSEKCCFCLVFRARRFLVVVPKSAYRIAHYADSYGPEFVNRLDPDSNNYMCREHFPSNAFGKHGRLLKHKVPMVDSEKVEVAYRIQGANFLKLNEKREGRHGPSGLHRFDEAR